MTNIIKLVLVIGFLCAQHPFYSQSNETCYLYTFVRSYEYEYGEVSSSQYMYKHIIYVSPIYSGKCGELEQKTDEFEKAHYNLVNNFVSEQPKIVGRSLTSTDREQDIGFDKITSRNKIEINRNHLIEEYKEKGYEVILVDDETNTSSEITRTKTFFLNLKIDDHLYVDGHVIVKSKFEFFGYPYIVSAYENLTITDMRFESTSYYSASTDFLPYKPIQKPLIDANFWVWTPKVLNPNPTKEEHYKIFSYPVKRMATFSDFFDNKEVDAYFKNFNHSQKRDAYFWSNSILQNPKRGPMNTFTNSEIEITQISGLLAKELKDTIKKYEYDKEYDFWGNKKKKTTKEKKKDDFWNN